jgi:monoterpene epsilon-lactone hydrolase
MASPEFAAVLEQFRSTGNEIGNATTVEEQRAGYEAMAFPLPEGTSVTKVEANGVPCEWIVADGADPDIRLAYLHGGGYVIGNLNTHRHLSAAISRAAGCAVLAVDYRLAPEHPYPAAVEDAVAAYRFMRENGPNAAVGAAATFIAGDSAGGGLVLAAMLAARDAGVPLPDAAIPLSAWTDLAFTGESMETRKDVDPLITDLDSIATMANSYLNGADPKDPLASPLYADLAGLPPLLMQVGDAEVLLSDTTRLAEKARAAGVEVTDEVWPEMFHVFQHFCQAFPEAQEAVDRIGGFVRAHVKVAG